MYGVVHCRTEKYGIVQVVVHELLYKVVQSVQSAINGIVQSTDTELLSYGKVQSYRVVRSGTVSYRNIRCRTDVIRSTVTYICTLSYRVVRKYIVVQSCTE